MEERQLAAVIHREYRKSAEVEMNSLYSLRATFPLKSFPRTEARFMKAVWLAEVWGKVATELCGRQVDYLELWRSGK